MFELIAQLPTGLDAPTIVAGEAVAHQVAQGLSASEWLGPLAPIALSPFFGLATLSGIATFGPEWLQQRSPLFSPTSPLHSTLLFWTLAALAVFTSLPRLSKVSKPIALAAEKLEAYSAIIILLVVRLMSGSANSESSGIETQAILSAGFTTLPLDLLMALVAALNVLVVNAVKLFFEFLIWLTPFPMIDAMLEASNKTLCAALIGLYCFSPALATGLDLLLLIFCAMIVGWIYRRTHYYRELIAGPILAWLLPQWFAQRGESLNAFLDAQYGKLPRWTPVRLEPTQEGCYRISGRWFWRRIVVTGKLCDTSSRLLGNAVEFTAADGSSVILVHRRWVTSDEKFKLSGSPAPNLVRVPS